MAETPPAQGGKFGWLKAIIGTVAGLLSGACAMYFTPLVDKIIKPAKPLANFAVEHQGLTVTFQDRSNGGGEGWWDFGDGSPLEPVSSKQDHLTHTYAKPGNYTAKLSLRNYLGEESERSVSLQLDMPTADDPEVVAFNAEPTCPAVYAPATFRLTTKVKNAALLVFDFGDELPMKIVPDPGSESESVITFKEAGSHTIRLVAINGKKTVEQNQVVYVSVPPKGMASALLTVSDRGTQVEKLEITETLGQAFPPNVQASIYAIDRLIQARPGFTITDARLKPVSDQGVRNLKLQMAPDRLSVRLTGELAKGTGLLARKAPLPNLVVQVVLAEERRTVATRAPIQLAATLTVPGSTDLALPALPPNWANVERGMTLQMKDDDRVVWQEGQMPRSAPVVMQNRPCKLTATVVGDKIHVEVDEVKPGPQPIMN
jgi:PKD repeat protein